jgi:hypothetical protein
MAIVQQDVLHSAGHDFVAALGWANCRSLSQARLCLGNVRRNLDRAIKMFGRAQFFNFTVVLDRVDLRWSDLASCGVECFNIRLHTQ